MDDRDQGSLDLAARAFAILWSLSIVYHCWPHVMLDLRSGALLCAGLWLFVSGGASLAWVAVCLTHLAMFWSNLPIMPAREYASFIVDLIVLTGYATAAVRSGSWRVGRSELFLVTRPMLTIYIAYLMGWAVLHKLNSSFLSPEESWGPELHLWLIQNIRWLLFDAQWVPEMAWLRPYNQYLTLAAEGFIAIGVLFQRTRSAAAATIFVFFFLIGLSGVPGFSSTIYALALVLLDERLLARTLQRSRLFGREGNAPRVRFVAVIAWLISLGLVRAGVFVGGLFWYVPLLVLLIWTWRSEKVPLSAHGSIRPAWPFWLVFVFWTGNELSPYAGLKDYPLLRMYSNLRVDSCGSNHLILPAAERTPGTIITTPETWTSFGHDFRAGRLMWAYNRDFTFAEVARREQSSWEPITFGEVVASLARDVGVAYEEVQLVYLREGATVREDLATFLARERRHPFHRFFPLRPEAVAPCAERVLLPTAWPPVERLK